MRVCYGLIRVPGSATAGIAPAAGISLAAGTALSLPSAFGQIAAVLVQSSVAGSGWRWPSIATGLGKRYQSQEMPTTGTLLVNEENGPAVINTKNSQAKTRGQGSTAK